MSDKNTELYVLQRGTFDGFSKDGKQRVQFVKGDTVALTPRQAAAFKDAFVHQDVVKKEADLAKEQVKAEELAAQLEQKTKREAELEAEIADLKAKAATNTALVTPADAKPATANKPATTAKP